MHHVSTFLCHYTAIFLLALRLVFIRSRTEQCCLSGLVTNEGENWRDLSCTRVKGVCRPAISHNLWFFFFSRIHIWIPPGARWLRHAMWRSSYRSLPASASPDTGEKCGLIDVQRQTPTRQHLYLPAHLSFVLISRWSQCCSCKTSTRIYSRLYRWKLLKAKCGNPPFWAPI